MPLPASGACRQSPGRRIDSATSMSSILPKGIVVNTPQISGDIQRIDREPLALDEIAKFWKVYTTTKRRLVDPTAERLENFWWRIWGSRKRNLRGATVARMFADISDEVSFVPLRGPLNRDESGGRPTTSLPRGIGTASTTVIHGRQESDSSNGRHSSSLSKSVAALPPPILKKSRGPSTTGPRPTARFISPHTSEGGEEEGDDVVVEASSVTGPGARVIVRPPTPPNPVLQRSKDDKKAESSAGSRKKGPGFVAATAANKRRPGVPKRPNSDPAVRAQDTASTSLNSDICESLPGTTNDPPGSRISQNQSDINEQASPSAETLLSVSASRKTRSGKSSHSKAPPRRSSTPKHGLHHEPATSSTLHGLEDEAEPSGRPRQSGRKHDGLYKGDAAPEDNKSQTQAHRNLVSEGYPQPQPETGGQSPAPRESSPTLRNEKAILHPNQHYLPKNLDAKSSISVAPTYATVTGETDQRDKPGLENAEHQSTSVLDNDGEGSAQRQDQAPLFAKRQVQPPRSASALFASPTPQSNGSMNRSKSQLTLLLERDRAKEKEKRKA